MRIFLAAFFVVSCCSAWGQEPAATETPTEQRFFADLEASAGNQNQDTADKPQKEATAVEVLSQLKSHTDGLDAKLATLQDAHAEAIAKAEAVAVDKLKQIARTEAGAGQIAKATKTWTEVLKLNGTDADARKFFAAIGRTDLVKAQVASLRPTRLIHRTEFRCEDGRVFTQKANGFWFDSAGPKAQETGRTEHRIMLAREGRALELMFTDELYLSRRPGKDWVLIQTGKWVK